MATIDPRVQYYAAGVLTWAQGRGNRPFALIDLESWSRSPIEPYDDLEPYLSNAALLGLAIDELVEMQILRREKDRYGPDMFSLEDLQELSWVADRFPDSVYEKASRYGQGWIIAAIEKINRGAEEPPNIDAIEVRFTDRWEPLPLDRKSPEVLDIFDALDRAIGEVASDNGFSASYPDERDNIVSHAQVTLASAREGKVTRQQVQQHFVLAGKWIAEKFFGTAIGTVGAELVKWGLKLLGFLN